MSRTRYVVTCAACRKVLPKCQPLGDPCALCGQPLEVETRKRTPYAGEDLIGAYGSGPKEKPWPEIKEGPLKGQNIVPGGLKTLKEHGKRTGVTWQ